MKIKLLGIFRRKNRNDILRYEGVTGVGKGKKMVGGELTDQDSTIVFVEKKLPRDEIKKGEVIPDRIDGLETDVIETGEITPASALHRKRHRPIFAGTSMAHIGGSACTAGIPVYKNGVTYSLVNLHCATPWMDDPQLEVDMVQPSPWDGGKIDDVVGKTMARYLFSFDKENLMDTALVAMDTALEPKTPVRGHYSPLTANLKAGDQVHKEGRTSGLTAGRIIATNVTALVNYKTKDGGKRTARFKNQIFTEPHLIFGGDSSSAVFDKDRNVVGQVYAGSDQVGVITPIDQIIDYFGVSLSKPTKGYIAAGSWMEFDRLNIITKHATNLRSEPALGNNVIKVIPRGTRVRILNSADIRDRYLWIEVEI